VCASDTVRRSRRKPALAFYKRWLGLVRYRCQDCGKVFYRPLSPAEREKMHRMKSEKRTHPRPDQAASPARKRRFALEVLVFLLVLAFSFAALRYFVS